MSMLHLAELAVRDFAGFRGFHRFQFSRGLNLVRGTCRSGKTNLVRALEFALLGRTRDRPTHYLINHHHLCDCARRGTAPDCMVSAVLRRDGGDMTVWRRLLHSSDGSMQIVARSDALGEMTVEWFDRIVIRELDIEPLERLSIGESTPIFVLDTLSRNRDEGLGMAVLDGVLGRLTETGRREMLNDLKALGLVQMILLEPPRSDTKTLDEFEGVVELPGPRSGVYGS